MFPMRQVGTTDVTVTNVSLGTGSLGNLYVEISEQEAQAVLEHAWERGIRYFDTAPLYGHGLAEVRLGRFLKGKPRSEYVVSTKVGRVLTPGKQHERVGEFINPMPNDIHSAWRLK